MLSARIIKSCVTKALSNAFCTAKASASIKKGQISQVPLKKFRLLVLLSMYSLKATFLQS